MAVLACGCLGGRGLGASGQEQADKFRGASWLSGPPSWWHGVWWCRGAVCPWRPRRAGSPKRSGLAGAQLSPGSPAAHGPQEGQARQVATGPWGRPQPRRGGSHTASPVSDPVHPMCHPHPHDIFRTVSPPSRGRGSGSGGGGGPLSPPAAPMLSAASVGTHASPWPPWARGPLLPAPPPAVRARLPSSLQPPPPPLTSLFPSSVLPSSVGASNHRHS